MNALGLHGTPGGCSARHTAVMCSSARERAVCFDVLLFFLQAKMTGMGQGPP